MTVSVHKMIFGIFYAMVLFLTLLLLTTFANATDFKGVWRGTYEVSVPSDSKVRCQCGLVMNVEQDTDDPENVQMIFSAPPVAKSGKVSDNKTCQSAFVHRCDGVRFSNQREMPASGNTFKVSISKTHSDSRDVTFIFNLKDNQLEGKNFQGATITLKSISRP